MTIHTDQYSIKALFEQKQTFVVPKYQRGYAWDDEAISDFIEDISECFEARRAGTEKHHFFGGVVTVRKEVGGSTRDNYEVIDGQQRLASFVLLAGSIVKHIKATIAELNGKDSLDDDENKALSYLDETIKKVSQLYLTFRDNKGIEYTDVPKLNLSKADDTFFQEVLAGSVPAEKTRESHNRIVYAWESLCKFVQDKLVNESLSAAEKAIHIQQFLDGVLGKDCTAIFMCSDARPEAYQIFQVLNDRGVHLGKGDLLRAGTLELLDEKKFEATQDKVASQWDAILAYAPKVIDDYLLWYFSSMEGRRPKPVELAEEFLEHRFKCKDQDSVSAQGATTILSEAERLNSAFGTLAAMNDGDWPCPKDKDVSAWDRERLRMLVTHLKHTNAMPLLLSLTLLKPKHFAEAITCIERFVFRYKTIVNAHVTPMTNAYLRQAKSIRDGPDKYHIKDLRNELSELIDKYAPDSIFETAVKEIKFSPRGNAYIRYFLITIEDYMKWYESGAQGVPKCKDKTRVFDVSKTTIEHIYSQNAKGESKDDTIEGIKHTLGNLTILSPEDNDALANKPPDKKFEVLANSNLKMNRDIAINEDWTREKTEERTETLAKMAMKIFVP
ncbi:MAG: DUF262 domain-containing HNH endonuclease family protein [Candidatus Thiodiazotropha sp.]